METKIKNTLFRFTSLRKPELISDEKKAAFFVHHPRASESDLYATTEAAFQTKLDEFAASVSPVKVKDKDGLKALNPQLYDFGFWLLQNRESVSPQDYMAKIDELSLTMQLSDDDEDLVWDNFIYQISRHTDESARETAMVLLYANYIYKEITVSDSLLPGGATIDKTEKELKRWLQARIVRPEYLSFSVPPVSDPGTPADPLPLSIQTQKQFKAAQERLISSIKISKLQDLQKELKSSAKKYKKAEADNFKAYKTQYDSDYSDYLVLLQNPVDSFTGEPEPLPQPPAYNYIPLPQLDIDVLETQLSADSLSFYNEIKSDEIATFSDIDKLINDNLKDETETIFNNKIFSTTYKSVGGMLVPVTNNNLLNNYTCDIFQTGSDAGKRNFGITIIFPNNTLAVRYIDYKITVETVEKEHLTFSPGIGVNNGGVVTGSLFYSPHGVEVSPSDEILFEADLTTTDGKKYTISKILDLNKKLNPAILVPVTTGTAVDPKDPIKSYTKYGITRLGIADYRRVEQTICCYVPGEVSHIENIMSREYKERSTKRLRRSETTVTTEKSTETENLTDTTSTDRNEMHQEMSKMMQESKDFNASAGIKFGDENKGLSGHIDAAFAYHNNKEESNSQARTQARELTERAMDRVVTKVREERISKIIDEFTEENKHGYDNREGNNHISGVYRWVDKIYTNEIFNYGKRLMYEFMIPEPSKFHLIYTNGEDRKNNLVKPVDPRLDPDPTTRLVKFTDVTAANYAKWASFYNADVEAPPFLTLNMGKSYNGQGGDGKNSNNFNDFKIPEGYRVTEINCAFNLKIHTNFNVSAYIIVADVITPTGMKNGYEAYEGLSAAVTSWRISYSPLIAYTRETIPVSIVTWDVGAYALNVNATFERTDEWMTKWQVATFHKIIQAYEDQLAMYEQKLAEFQSQTAEQRRTNPLFNRDIENMVLRKNCISYILGYDYLGKNFQAGTTVFDHSIMPDAVGPDGVVLTEVQGGISLIQYASMAKFIEQAFEWEIMSYIFYPFYWGTGKDWETLYGGNADDTLFAKFIQSGLARVVITVRPGFEDAVNWFLNTGQIWNGMSSPPVIGDDMYLSIVEELQEPEYFVEGSWETRVPSTLTVIQAGIIGLDASGLPCECKREYDGDGNVISGSKDEIKQYNSAYLESGGSGGGVWEIIDEGSQSPPIYVPPGNPTS